ncbi:MAG: hypothetical protein IPG29_13070 [Sphingobacteriales bacterium]|nr:hypothetical protein [Sphingobacteriales bacterium]
MEETNPIKFLDNPEFNDWLNDNFPIVIEEYEFHSGEVLYNQNYEAYIAALERYNKDPQIVLWRILENFPTPIAYYIDQAENNYQNEHHRLDLLKSCWEAIIFFIYGLVVAEARHRNIPLKTIGLFKWDTFRSDRVHDKLNIVENILDYVTKNAIPFECASIIPIATLADIRKLNQERNGFEHAAAKNSQQQRELYRELFPLVTNVLNQLIGLEKVKLFRYHEAAQPLFPRCEIFNGSDLGGRKEIVTLHRDNYLEILDEFNNTTVFAQINTTAFCLAPFIHFFQEVHETNALICFFKKHKGGKYKFEVVSKSQDKEFEIADFDGVETKLKSLII